MCFMRKYYPLSLDIQDQKCVVVGAGIVAYQKIKKLLIYRPQILVIAKEIKSPEIAKLTKTKKINFKQTQYNKKFLAQAILVIAATNNKKLNSQIQKDAKKANILVNVVDDKKLCQFICPAIIETNRLQIAITTHGQNPKKAREAREILEKNLHIFDSKKIIKLGTRKSPLALTQVNEFIAAFHKIKPSQIFQIITFDNQGDIDKKSKIENISFSNKIEEALEKKEIDMALHSAKDIDEQIDSKNKSNLMVLWLSKSIDAHEALVSPKDYTLKTLPKNARVGASGQRRREQLKQIRPDLKLVPIRGNIEERLGLIEKKKLDGVIIAMAALKRLGLDFLASDLLYKLGVMI